MVVVGVLCILYFCVLTGLFIFFFKGVKPMSFEKVENPEIKDIIEHCIRPRKEDR
jgi:nitrogen regulatory protein PII-like uncharacterized protein